MSENSNQPILDAAMGDCFARMIGTAKHVCADSACPRSEREQAQELNVLLGLEQANLDFRGAGVDRYYASALAQRCSIEVQGSGVDVMSPWRLQGMRAYIERALQDLFATQPTRVISADSASVLSQMLTSWSADSMPLQAAPRKVLLPKSIQPAKRTALQARLNLLGIECHSVDFDAATGRIEQAQLQALNPQEFFALVVPWPNFFGLLENLELIKQWSEAADITLCAWVNPHVLSWIKSPEAIMPGLFACQIADAQPLGLPNVRSGATTLLAASDSKTLEWAGANLDRINNPDISTLHAAIQSTGLTGFAQAGQLGHQTLTTLIDKLVQIDRVTLAFDLPFTHEAVIRVEGIDLAKGHSMLGNHNIVAGYPLASDYPELADCLLLHCNDLHRDKDLDRFVNRFAAMVRNLSTAPCPVKPKFT